MGIICIVRIIMPTLPTLPMFAMPDSPKLRGLWISILDKKSKEKADRNKQGFEHQKVDISYALKPAKKREKTRKTMKKGQKVHRSERQNNHEQKRDWMVERR